MASIFDVAAKANVSPSTVSLVVNHRNRVSPQTRDRVDDAIRRLGYQPSRRRSMTAAKRAPAMRLAFLYTLQSMFDHGMSSSCRGIIQGIQAELGEVGSLTILRGIEHADDDAILHQQLEAHELDGVVLFGPEKDNGYLERLEATGLPLVVFNRLPTHGQFSCVTPDYYNGARIAARHVLELGHRRIACLTIDSPEKWLVRQLRDGLQDALHARDVEPIMADRGPTALPDGIPAACRRMLEHGATALVTGDVPARLVADHLATLGVSVPEDFSIIGFDDLGLTTRRGQALTSIGYDKRRMGHLAVRMITQLIQDKEQANWMVQAVPTRLVAGETTAPPAPRPGSNGDGRQP